MFHHESVDGGDNDFDGSWHPPAVLNSSLLRDATIANELGQLVSKLKNKDKPVKVPQGDLASLRCTPVSLWNVWSGGYIFKPLAFHHEVMLGFMIITLL
ncbi:hypothetical protein V6N13_104884 [Hibiscus sabdariffa]|uniref:Uncharacterized protein n=1 Tax=Hibiscus sabdariffa TaxID=183260 RepID=A0ABR2SJ18_9ROSI